MIIVFDEGIINFNNLQLSRKSHDIERSFYQIKLFEIGRCEAISALNFANEEKRDKAFDYIIKCYEQGYRLCNLDEECR